MPKEWIIIYAKFKIFSEIMPEMSSNINLPRLTPLPLPKENMPGSLVGIVQIYCQKLTCARSGLVDDFILVLKNPIEQ